MPRKGEKLQMLKAGQLPGAATVNKLIGLYNSFMNSRSDASASDIMISDNNIIFPKGESNNSGGTSAPVWLP